jgi:hypothetical protein
LRSAEFSNIKFFGFTTFTNLETLALRKIQESIDLGTLTLPKLTSLTLEVQGDNLLNDPFPNLNVFSPNLKSLCLIYPRADLRNPFLLNETYLTASSFDKLHLTQLEIPAYIGIQDVFGSQTNLNSLYVNQRWKGGEWFKEISSFTKVTKVKFEVECPISDLVAPLSNYENLTDLRIQTPASQDSTPANFLKKLASNFKNLKRFEFRVFGLIFNSEFIGRICKITTLEHLRLEATARPFHEPLDVWFGEFANLKALRTLEIHQKRRRNEESVTQAPLEYFRVLMIVMKAIPYLVELKILGFFGDSDRIMELHSEEPQLPSGLILEFGDGSFHYSGMW